MSAGEGDLQLIARRAWHGFPGEGHFAEGGEFCPVFGGQQFEAGDRGWGGCVGGWLCSSGGVGCGGLRGVSGGRREGGGGSRGGKGFGFEACEPSRG